MSVLVQDTYHPAYERRRNEISWSMNCVAIPPMALDGSGGVSVGAFVGSGVGQGPESWPATGHESAAVNSTH